MGLSDFPAVSHEKKDPTMTQTQTAVPLAISADVLKKIFGEMPKQKNLDAVTCLVENKKLPDIQSFLSGRCTRLRMPCGDRTFVINRRCRHLRGEDEKCVLRAEHLFKLLRWAREYQVGGF